MNQQSLNYLERYKKIEVDMLNTLIEGIIITDSNGNIQYVNSAFSQITGYSLKEVLHQNPRILNSGRQEASFYESMWKSIYTTGQWQGEIWNRRKNGEVYLEWLRITVILDEEGTNKFFVGVFSDITELKHLKQQIAECGQDTLTGLMNRYSLLDRVKQMIPDYPTSEEALALILFDIDRFKNINDSLGHDIGDHILKQITLRIKECLQHDDLFARMGGDEFAIAIKRSPEEIKPFLKKITTAIKNPIFIMEQELYITSSIGISVSKEAQIDWEEMMQKADFAMYQAKEHGGDNLQFFHSKLSATAHKRVELESQLRKALELDQFMLYYQPKVDLVNGEVFGVEALIRWRSSNLGLVSPADFIPLAEETGMIIPIGEWVLNTACKQAKAWIDDGYPPIFISVNLSMRQFQQKDLVAMVARALHESQLPPKYLELEITESFAMANLESAMKKLAALKQLGVKISIDDFGTGYSSLSYLKRFPIDTLKIDQSFIRDLSSSPDGDAIPRAIIELAHSLKCNVIAEGVEHAEQIEWLKQFNCDHAQGYYYSRPVPAEDIIALLHNREKTN